MGTIDLGPPLPRPADLLDGLPRRVALTLPELRLVAGQAGGAPLPFEVRAPDHVAPAAGAAPAGRELSDRLGSSPRAGEQAAYADALAGLRDPVATLSRRGLLVGGPVDGTVDPGLLGAVGLLATPDVAIDLDVTVAGLQVRCWHRRAGGAVAALSTHDGVVFELAWFPTWAWGDELARIAVLPEDLALRESIVPDLLDVPHQLLDAALEAVRTHRGDLVPVLLSQQPGGVVDGDGIPLPAARAVAVLTALGTESQGRLRALVAQVHDGESLVVGVVAWTLVADGWRALRPHRVEDRLRVEIARVIPEGLATELAPVLAEVAGGAR